MLRLSVNLSSVCDRSLCCVARGMSALSGHRYGNVGSENVKQYTVVITDALRETVIEISIRTLLATLKIYNIIYPATIRDTFENRQRRGHGISL